MPNRQDYDPALIASAQQGDPGAIEALLVQAQPDLARFARRVCATPEDVEDAVQEALWRVSRQIGALRTASAFVGWAFRVVTHECYRLLRRTRREDGLDDATHVLTPIAPPEDQADLKRDIVAAMLRLPPSYRQVLLLRDVQDFSAPEVASQLGLTIEAVKSRLHRARAMMRVDLQDWV